MRLHASFSIPKVPDYLGAKEACYNMLAICQENPKLKAGGSLTDLVSLNNADS